jgi:hypothetical protein
LLHPPEHRAADLSSKAKLACEAITTSWLESSRPNWKETRLKIGGSVWSQACEGDCCGVKARKQLTGGHPRRHPFHTKKHNRARSSGVGDLPERESVQGEELSDLACQGWIGGWSPGSFEWREISECLSWC